jgi:Zn-dependent protease
MVPAVTVGRVARIPVTIQASWVPVFLFVTWTLGARYFPLLLLDLPTWTNWLAAVLVSSLVFLCLLAHEFGHAMVARWRGLVVVRVSLFFLGGAAEIDVDGGKPEDEFWMALAGPGISVTLGLIWGSGWLGLRGSEPLLSAALVYLALCNLLLAGFNLLPGYPLDGGRLVRAALWRATGDQGHATRLAGWFGQGLGVLVVAGGVAWALTNGLMGGFWLVAAGLFLVLAARGASPQSRLSS